MYKTTSWPKSTAFSKYYRLKVVSQSTLIFTFICTCLKISSLQPSSSLKNNKYLQFKWNTRFTFWGPLRPPDWPEFSLFWELSVGLQHCGTNTPSSLWTSQPEPASRTLQYTLKTWDSGFNIMVSCLPNQKLIFSI